MRRPSPSVCAATVWLAGGVLGTVAVQAATGGEHSVSDGLRWMVRRAPVTSAVVAGSFALHIVDPAWYRGVDPWHALGVAARRLAR